MSLAVKNYAFFFNPDELLQGIIDTLREDCHFSSNSEKKSTTNRKDRVSQAGYLSVENSALYHHLRTNYASKQFEFRDGEKWPVTDLSGKRKRITALAQLRPNQSELMYDYEKISEWEQRVASFVKDMNDVTADVLDIISSVWLKNASHPEDTVFVTADDFLRLRGLTPQKGGTGRRGGYKSEWRAEIAKHIDILKNTWITVSQMPVTEIEPNGKRNYKVISYEGPAIIESGHVGLRTSEGNLDVYSWRVRPGNMFTQHLIAGRQAALLSRQAVEYHPIRQHWEKRLTRYFAHIWRIRQSRGNYSDGISVSKLIEAIGEHVNVRNPSRTKERFEKALDKLEEDGVIMGWQYGPTLNEDIVGEPGWVESWMEWTVSVEPPTYVVNHYAHIQQFSSDQATSRKTEPDLANRLKALSMIFRFLSHSSSFAIFLIRLDR